MQYDSTADTLLHIKRVNELLLNAVHELISRAQKHDQSKLESPEKEIFDQYTPILKGLEYGSEEYKENMKNLQVAIQHHYSKNTHHPEHYETGINGMNLFDIIEMFCDWKAATERTKNGSFEKSLEINADRFKMSDQLVEIFKNTAWDLGYFR